MINDIVAQIGDIWFRLSTKSKKAVAGILATITIFNTANMITKDDKKNIYLVDLKDKYQDDAVLLDENGNEIEITTSDRENLLAIVDIRKTKNGEMYPVILVDDNGILSEGYMDGKYLKNKAEDTIKVQDDDMTDFDVYNVVAINGAYMREKKKVNKNTNKAELLENGEEIISTGITETSSKNSYDWMRVIHFNPNKKELSYGYMVSNYLMNDDYELAKGKRFIIKNTPKGILRIRSSAEIPKGNNRENVLITLKEGTEVILVPGFPSVSDGKYDWFYVACKLDDEWIYGYAAATQYNDNDMKNYLEEVITESDENGQIRSCTTMVVDTSKAKNADLKLREAPGTDSKIIAKIENGTNIYVYKDSLEKPIEKGGFKWVEVKLLNGEVGYVAQTYLIDNENVVSKEIEKRTIESNNTSQVIDYGEPIKVNFNGEERVGYIGIDVDNKVEIEDLKELFEHNHDYIFNDNGYKLNSGSSINFSQTPDFVYLKIGATGFGKTFDFPSSNSGEISKMASCSDLCNQYKIPYGLYYFCQATTEEEIEREVSEIKRLYNQVGTSEYNVLPFMLDFEALGGKTRIVNSANENGKAYQTDIINKTMNRVREELGVDVILYTDYGTLESTFNYNDLDNINQKNCFIVEASATHTNNLDKKVLKNSAFSQIRTDTTVSGVRVDIDFAGVNPYEGYTKKLKR